MGGVGTRGAGGKGGGNSTGGDKGELSEVEGMRLPSEVGVGFMKCIVKDCVSMRGRVGVLRYRRAGDGQLIVKTEGEVDSIDVAVSI